MLPPGAFIFDLNGTLIDDMEYHVKAWYEILNQDLNAGLSWPQVRAQMYGKNSELLERVFGAGAFDPAEADRWSMEKERRYQQGYRPHLALLPGLAGFLDKAAGAGIAMAIGSAAIPFNIDFVLDNLHIRRHFSAIVSADDVAVSKPHPETFLQAAALLGVQPDRCIVFEDAPKGVEAAMHAGMQTVVITSMHGAESFTDYPNILGFISDYHDPLLHSLLTVSGAGHPAKNKC